MDDSGSLVSGLSVDTIAASAPTARPGSDYPAGSMEETVFVNPNATHFDALKSTQRLVL